jgi:hypothetical protein
MKLIPKKQKNPFFKNGQILEFSELGLLDLDHRFSCAVRWTSKMAIYDEKIANFLGPDKLKGEPGDHLGPGVKLRGPGEEFPAKNHPAKNFPSEEIS